MYLKPARISFHPSLNTWGQWWCCSGKASLWARIQSPAYSSQWTGRLVCLSQMWWHPCTPSQQSLGGISQRGWAKHHPNTIHSSSLATHGMGAFPLSCVVSTYYPQPVSPNIVLSPILVWPSQQNQNARVVSLIKHSPVHQLNLRLNSHHNIGDEWTEL